MNSIDYLDAVKTRYNWESDYKLAKELNISRSRMSAYRNCKNTLGDNLCLQVAKLLKLKPEIVLIDVLAERTKFPKVSKILHKTAKQLTSIMVSLLLTFTIIYSTLLPTDVMASNVAEFSNNVYYVKWIIDLILYADSHPITFFMLFLANQLFMRYLLHFRQMLKKR